MENNLDGLNFGLFKWKDSNDVIGHMGLNGVTHVQPEET